MRNLFLALLFLSLSVFCPSRGVAQSGTSAVPPTEISADMGTCSALITVTGTDSKPVYNAKVSTRIHYGMMGVKKLDLETFTSANGQVRIVKLPEVPKKPVYIYITKDDKWATVEFQPDIRCRANFDVVLK
ncbi:MAG TPA: hypothetical protein VM578_06960 [Candidatus Saccharimonadales bacterium]|nr:hypothetical protein [Candidatus Saccharimonadales bacterium]